MVTAELPGSAATTSTSRCTTTAASRFAGVRRERERPCEQYHRIERGHGSFSRTFHLPVPVDADRITADLRDGVLTVTCPKAPRRRGRRIHIT